MKSHQVNAAIKNGENFTFTIRPRMGLKLIFQNVKVRRGPKYTKKDGRVTMLLGMQGEKKAIKVRVDEITEIS